MLAAYALDQRGYSVTLLEQKQRGGGLIKTTRTEHGIAESAAHSLITMMLCESCAAIFVLN